MTTVLIVDDDRLYRLVLIETLREAGYAVLAAANGREARSYLRGDIDLALLDGQLPDTSGLSLLEELRALHPACPAVLVTGHPTSHDEAKAASLGAFRYMEKPVDSSEILTVVRQALDAGGASRRESVRL